MQKKYKCEDCGAIHHYIPYDGSGCRRQVSNETNNKIEYCGGNLVLCKNKERDM